MKNFLMDKDYYIDIFNNKLHAFNYIELIKIGNDNIKLQFTDFMLDISGNNLKISQMNKEEILIVGIINNIGIER